MNTTLPALAAAMEYAEGFQFPIVTARMASDGILLHTTDGERHLNKVLAWTDLAPYEGDTLRNMLILRINDAVVEWGRV